MPFNLYTSNRLEVLSEALVQSLRKPLASVLEQEIIVVQSKGMERWISMELARKQGICANVRFPFPNTFVYEILREFFPDLPETSLYDRQILTWKIMQLLPACMDRPEFKSLKEYLQGTASSLKRLQLSTRIADLFDQYLLFRPEMIFKWERGEESHWQAELWREIAKESQKAHRAALGKKLVELLNDPAADLPELPKRVSVFGISALPEFHMQLFSALTRFAEVNLFLMNPCREYWGDIVSESEIRRASKKKDKDLTLDLFHFDKGNSLLASMGKLGRDFFDVIEEQFDYQPFEQFEDPGEHSLLTDLQSDILNLRDRGLTGDPKQAISDTDTSLQIHSCHSPRREIEVLQDHLLHLFETNPDLRPSDILVMTPDIEPVAPYIQSVFDLPFENPKRIPYSIADRSYGREDEIVETFFGILNLQGSRFGAAQVLTILEAPAVQKKFDLSEDDIELIHNWVRDTRIRWGKNAQDRRRLGLPEHAQNTWQAGLERLLLGYALPGRDETLYNGSILPYPHVEGDQSLVLGRFLEFTEYLFDKVDALGKKRMLQQWHTKLDELLDTFFESDDETVAEIQVIRRALVELDGFEHLSGFDEPIELKVVRHHLETKLHREGHGYGFLTGGVTFCSMLPMRSIPARIICLVGMNNDAYPRRNIQLGFDLMAKQPRKGDRSRRNDDRYLFLEALLSAREHLYISYVGQSIKDNSLIPPSVVVGELLDYISANFTTEESRILEHVTTRHRLQAFSPEYFRGGDRLFSYSHENMQAACHLLAPREAPKPFLMERLTEPQKEFKEVRLSDLYRFFRNPCRFLLNRRLGVYLDESTAVLEEKETFALRGLDRYKVAEKLLEKKVAGLDTEDVKRAAIASGQLPHGAVGEYEVDTLNEKLEQFFLKTERYLKGRELEPLGIDLKLNEFHLTGHLDQITQSGLVVYRFARVQAKDHLRVWIQHLALNACAAGATPRESYLAGVDSAKDGNWVGWRFRPLDHSTEILTRLLQIYWEGLREPLRFFPNSAFAFIGRLKQGWKEEWARRSARKRWFGSDSERGEREDLYFQLCFGKEIDPLSQEFQTLASDVFSPVIETEEEISDG